MSQIEKSAEDSRVAASTAASARESFTSLLRNPFRRPYAWVLSLSEKKSGAWALFVLAFAESSFFPIPPDVLLIALALGTRKKAFKFALICTIGSVLGGAFGYFLGYLLYEPVAKPLVAFLWSRRRVSDCEKVLQPI